MDVMINAYADQVGFGTAALGGDGANVVLTTLETGFRKFDTAEESDHWYDQAAVGSALRSFFLDDTQEGEEPTCRFSCQDENLQISTKLPPWELTSVENIRTRAANSREQLVGFCDDLIIDDEEGNVIEKRPYPLDIYYIHAPECWDGWHPRCDGVEETMPLREAWMAMEAIVGIDGSASRIGLSNIWPDQLLDIIDFVNERKEQNNVYPPPRMPDALQVHADPLHPAKELRAICMEHDIEFVSYSTLGTQHHMRDGGGNPVLGNRVIRDLAQRYDRSTAEVVLSWALQQGMSVIPRSANEEHIHQLYNMVQYPPFLDDYDLASIDALALN
eukprot:scaffold71944_cov61-Attheya_sp.AAC.2